MRFTAAALLVHAAFGAAMLFATYRLMDHALQAQLEQAARRSHEQLAAALQPLLIERDFAGAEELLQSLVLQGGFDLIEVQDSSGRPFARASHATPPESGADAASAIWSAAARQHHHRAQLAFAGQPLGSVHFALDARDVLRAKADLLAWLGLLGGGGLAATATAQVLLTRRLSRRLTALADGAGQVAEGVHGVELPVGGSDDVARLTRSFNRMARTLEQRFTELEASERRQRELTEALAEGIVFQDREDRVLSCNDAAARILGLSREQLLGLDSLDPRWHATTADGRPFDFAEHPSVVALRTGQPVRDVVMGVQAPDRGTTWISINSQPLFAAGERVPHATVTSFSDITARIEAEQALARSNDDLERRVQQRTAELAAARDEAERASRAKSEFLSRMSHELRTPLNAILGFAQLMRLQPGGRANAGFDDQVRHIESAGWHLLRLIDEVLDLSRIEAGALLVSREPVALAPLVAESLRLVAEQARGQGLELVDDCAGHPEAYVRADTTRLRQVLVNLLSNACKYNRPGGSVRVSCRADGTRWVLAVEDSGRGMDAEQVAGLFQPFNRLGAEATGVQGTGIGLVITKRLVELMGGTIAVRSEPGIGSCFEVSLEQAEPAAAPPGSASAGSVPGEAPAAPLRLLLVEDNVSNVRLLRDVLRLRPGVALEVAADGPQGLQAARLQPPDAVVLDIALPGMDGLQVCRELRRLPQLAGVPVVALSANALPADVARGMAAGFDDYFTKPLDVGRFLAWIDGMLRARKPA